MNCDNLKMNLAFLTGYLLSSFVKLSVEDQGSTPRIKEIVIGRCNDFQHKTIGSDLSKWKDCNRIWKTFHQGFAYKNPCGLTQDDYKPYFDEAGMPETNDKVNVDWIELF